MLYSTRAGARSSLVAHLRRSCRRREYRSLSRDAALTRRLSGGAGARASSSCSPLVGAALLPVMGRPCRSNRCVGSALAGARVFGGRRSCHGIARRRAGRLLGWCGGVACIRVCTFEAARLTTFSSRGRPGGRGSVDGGRCRVGASGGTDERGGGGGRCQRVSWYSSHSTKGLLFARIYTDRSAYRFHLCSLDGPRSRRTALRLARASSSH